MTSTPHAFPDWVAPGASVVEVNHDRAVRAMIVRVTHTGLVRLDNGAAYRLASHGRALHKTGEQGPWFGNRRPTELLPAAEHLRRQSSAIVAKAIGEIAQLDCFARQPSAVLAQMQAAVDAARNRLAEVEQEAAVAGGVLATGAVAT